MGMFDSIYDAQGNEWQTKAYNRLLDTYRIGDEMPGPSRTYQVEILGGPADEKARDSYAIVEDGILAKVDVARIKSFDLLSRHGNWELGIKPAQMRTEDSDKSLVETLIQYFPRLSSRALRRLIDEAEETIDARFNDGIAD